MLLSVQLMSSSEHQYLFHSRTEEDSKMGQVVTGTGYSVIVNFSRTSLTAPIPCNLIIFLTGLERL